MDLGVDVGRLLGLSQLPSDSLLALVVGGTLDLPALLETVCELANLNCLNLVHVTYRATTSWYFQPNS